ncbi:MAG: hypothetical protein R3264_12895 [Anaerolineae bacterium]|nr:hypothetical protein [Anaerolineae bacterium]
MKHIRPVHCSNTAWEHVFPFLLMWLLINSLMFYKTAAIWAMLMESGLEAQGASNFLALSFLIINLCCLLGYLLSRICVMTVGKIYDTTRQFVYSKGII